MSVLTGALAAGRRQAEARFTETFTFYTSAEGDADPVTLDPTTVETVIASGIAGRLKFTTTEGLNPEVAGQYPVLGRREVHVAVGSVNVSPGVFARVTASTADAGLVGRVCRLAERPAGGQVTSWRYPAIEVS